MFGFDLTYYKNNNYHQYVLINAPNGSGFTQYYLNLGNIQNTGFEISAYVTPIQTNKLKWTSTFNFAARDEYIVTDGEYAGQRGFFTRDASGEVTGVDLAGRLANRV